MKTDYYLNKLLSFTSLALAWMGALTLKFYLYDVAGWGEVWHRPPTFSEEAGAYFGYTFGSYGIVLILAAGLLDYLCWPYFFRTETKEVIQIFAADKLESMN